MRKVVLDKCVYNFAMEMFGTALQKDWKCGKRPEFYH